MVRIGNQAYAPNGALPNRNKLELAQQAEPDTVVLCQGSTCSISADPVPEAGETSPPRARAPEPAGSSSSIGTLHSIFQAPRVCYFTSFWIRAAISWRTLWLRVMTSTVSSPAMVPMISDQPA